MTPDVMRLPGDPATLDRVAALYAQLAPWRLPLIRAVRDGGIALLEMPRRAPWPKRTTEGLRKPAIFIIPDDDEVRTGPNGFLSARRASYSLAAPVCTAPAAMPSTTKYWL